MEPETDNNFFIISGSFSESAQRRAELCHTGVTTCANSTPFHIFKYENEINACDVAPGESGLL